MTDTQAQSIEAGVTSHCIGECLDCRRQCLETAARILSEGSGHPLALVAQLWDCADVCETNAGLMLRNSALIGRTCETCAEICELCAQECGRFVDDLHLQACALGCRRCAASCRDTAERHRNHTPHI